MADSGSAEYRTLVRLTSDIQVAVKNSLVSLGGALVSAELIEPGQYDGIKNEHNSPELCAANLVGYVQTKVQQNRQHYHTFIGVLKGNQAQNKDILRKLKETYDSLNTDPPPPPGPDPAPNGMSESF